MARSDYKTSDAKPTDTAPGRANSYELTRALKIGDTLHRAGETVVLSDSDAADYLAMGQIKAPVPGYNRRDMRARD